MPAVLVHGVPDTYRVWRRLRRGLRRDDIVTLSLPGFGSKLPRGFEPSKDAYIGWLLERLAEVQGPLDLVGHDWGALLVTRIVLQHPEIVRSWVVGSAPLDPEYEWHDVAQVWQTQGSGERFMERMDGASWARGLVAAGVPVEDALETARHIDHTMGRCILGLYRSAMTLGADWAPALGPVAAPGIVLWGTADAFAAPRFGERLARATGARFVPLSHCGHWWQLERPAEVAERLDAFWWSLR